MTSIDDIIEDIVDREGGYNYEHVKGDRGGPTKGGITIGRLRTLRGPSVTWEDVRDLTSEEIRDIYKSDYYLKPRINRLPVEIQPVVMDFYTTSGTWAIKSLQRILREFGYNEIELDGKIGPQTVRCVFNCLADVPLDVFINAYCHERARFYRQIWQNDPSQEKFAKGWNNRAMAFLVKNREYAEIPNEGDSNVA